MKKPSKKECDAYIIRKYASSDSEIQPKNICYTLEDGMEFAYIKTIGNKKGITIKKK